MTDERKQRIAENEAIFRAANERMAGWEEHHADDDREPYFCECANPDCREKIELTRSEYERVRANPLHFFIKPGHEIPDAERVIDQFGDWLVIEKNEEVAEHVRATDPRA